MKILFQSRLELFEVHGGDTTQIVNTKEALEKLGHEVIIDNKFDAVKKAKYDIVHLFNIDWIVEPYRQLLAAKSNGVPIVLSTIHHSELRQELMEAEVNYDFRIISNFLLPGLQANAELKNLYRGMFVDWRKFIPAIEQVLMGIKNQQKYVLNNADRLVVQTDLEKDDLMTDFDLDLSLKEKMYKVVNGINLDIFYNANDDFYNSSSLFKDINKDNFVISCTGRLEPRKNQIAILKAIKNLPVDIQSKIIVILIGDSTIKKHKGYMRELTKYENSIKAKVIKTGILKPVEVASVLKNSNLFMLPSYYETSGLVYLEAMAVGIPIIYTTNRATEYLNKRGVFAYYSEPNDIELLTTHLNNVLAKNYKITVTLENVYTWDQAAMELEKIYRDLVIPNK